MFIRVTNWRSFLTSPCKHWLASQDYHCSRNEETFFPCMFLCTAYSRKHPVEKENTYNTRTIYQEADPVQMLFFFRCFTLTCNIRLSLWQLPPLLETVALQLTLKDVLELVLLQGSCHRFLNGADVLIEFDHQRVIIHAGGIGHNGVVALLGQWNKIVEAVHPIEGKWQKIKKNFGSTPHTVLIMRHRRVFTIKVFSSCYSDLQRNSNYRKQDQSFTIQNK